jgi:hypothetical protein
MTSDGAGGEKVEGRSRCATKPPTPLLAAVDAGEQAQKLRVMGEELRHGRRRLLEGENRGMTWGVTVGGAAAARPVAEAVASIWGRLPK